MQIILSQNVTKNRSQSVENSLTKTIQPLIIKKSLKKISTPVRFWINLIQNLLSCYSVHLNSYHFPLEIFMLTNIFLMSRSTGRFFCEPRS